MNKDLAKNVGLVLFCVAAIGGGASCQGVASPPPDISQTPTGAVIAVVGKTPITFGQIYIRDEQFKLLERAMGVNTAIYESPEGLQLLRKQLGDLEVRAFGNAVRSALQNKVIADNDIQPSPQSFDRELRDIRTQTLKGETVAQLCRQMQARLFAMLDALNDVDHGKGVEATYRNKMAPFESLSEWQSQVIIYKTPESRVSLQKIRESMTPGFLEKSLEQLARGSALSEALSAYVDGQIAKVDTTFASDLKKEHPDAVERKYISASRAAWWQREFNDNVVIKDEGFRALSGFGGDGTGSRSVAPSQPGH